MFLNTYKFIAQNSIPCKVVLQKKAKELTVAGKHVYTGVQHDCHPRSLFHLFLKMGNGICTCRRRTI